MKITYEGLKKLEFDHVLSGYGRFSFHPSTNPQYVVDVYYDGEMVGSATPAYFLPTFKFDIIDYLSYTDIRALYMVLTFMEDYREEEDE